MGEAILAESTSQQAYPPIPSKKIIYSMHPHPQYNLLPFN